MSGRCTGGTPHKTAPGASRFGFRPTGDTTRIPCPASTRPVSPSTPIPGGALPQTKVLLETRARTQPGPKPCPARDSPRSPRTSGIQGPSRFATPTKSTCPCPPRAGPSTPRSSPAPPRDSTPKRQVVPCPAQSPRTPSSRPGSVSAARNIPHSQGYASPTRPSQAIRKPCPSASRQTSGLRPPGSSGLRPPSARPMESRVPCPSSQRTPTTSKAIAVPCPAKPVVCSQLSEDSEYESDVSEEGAVTTVAIVEEVKHKLDRKEEEEKDNVLANLEEMQHFRRKFILNSLPTISPPSNPLMTPLGHYPGYTGQFAEYVTDEMLEGRYAQFKRGGTKEQYFSNISDADDDDLDKIEPDFEIEELVEEEELEEFLHGGESCQRVSMCPMQRQREETYSEELFRVMRNGKGQ